MCACPPRGHRRSPCRTPRVGADVQQVVGDLERDAQIGPERDERLERVVLGAGGDRADLHRHDEAVPAGLLHDHLQVVVVGEIAAIPADPVELDGLALDRLRVMRATASRIRSAGPKPTTSTLSRSGFSERQSIASPTLTAMGTPWSTCNVGGRGA